MNLGKLTNRDSLRVTTVVLKGLCKVTVTSLTCAVTLKYQVTVRIIIFFK